MGGVSVQMFRCKWVFYNVYYVWKWWTVKKKLGVNFLVKASAVCSVIILPISNYYCIDLIKLWTQPGPAET